ncbi:hypothetical protein HYU96_01105 [Candidatus Daviesbacteria bacterium]|nr:hypothetical protein [Candidatus Daviesbacteria bacterium]
MTLTQIAVFTRRTIVLSAAALILTIVGFIGYKIWLNYYLSTLPPVEEVPDTKFGSLPSLEFPATGVSSSNFSYSLDTATGGLPKVGQDPGFGKIIRVYFIVKTYATFLSAQRSQDLAEKLGIKTSAQIVSETNYVYKQDNKILEVNLDSGNFKFKNEATPEAKPLNEESRLATDFKNVLSFLGILKEELKSGRSQVAGSQISIWPKDIDGKAIFTPEFNKSLINATVSGPAGNLENYLSLEFTFFPIDESTYATYPLRRAEEAFEDLKQGKGVVMIEPAKPQVSITSVNLGYYLAESYTPYLQPIYIFEGPQFVAFASAIGPSGN